MTTSKCRVLAILPPLGEMEVARLGNFEHGRITSDKAQKTGAKVKDYSETCIRSMNDGTGFILVKEGSNNTPTEGLFVIGNTNFPESDWSALKEYLPEQGR